MKKSNAQIIRLSTVLGATFGALAVPAMAQTEIPLHPDLKVEGQQTIVERGDAQRPNRSIRGSFVPTLTTYLPTNNPTGTAVVLCAGGGYGSLAIDLHGTEIARWLNERGVAGLILKYRFPRGDANLTDDPLPMADARRALQLARDNAKAWNLRADRIGMFGVSAGGNLAANAGTLFPRAQKPNFLILVSPVISMRDNLTNEGTRNALMGKNRDSEIIKRFSAELNVNAQTPPTFLVHAQNDKTAPPAASKLFFEALQKNGVPVTTFFPTDGGHSIDVAVKGDAAQWTQKLEDWMKERDLMATINAPVELAARPLPLADVRLMGGPLKLAQDVDATYLLSLEPDRMMAYYRIRAGLKPKAEGYGGWDGDGKNLTGHIAGHYLSAVSLMYAATGDARFKERADILVSEMKEVQAKNGDGSLLALEDGREKFAQVARGDIRSGGFDLNGLWAPWYVAHKTFAGLRDAHRLTGNRDALNVEVGFAGWAQSVLSNLNDAQTQQMLNTEFGGMNEVLAQLYSDTGDARWLTLSRRFEHHAVVDSLQKGEDKLAGLHANTQVPKLIGSLQRYLVTGDKSDEKAADFFWEQVANHHSFATGGHGKDEYFGPPDQLADRLDGRTAESCNVYNMLKMTREMFAISPDDKYAEFAERALFNHALASLDPATGRSCYMVPVGRGVRHEYQDMQHDFTCCVGSGMENPALYNDGTYYQAKDKLWVNIYAPSTANWREQNAKLTMETDFPLGESATLKLELAAPKQFTLMLRRPKWAGAGFAVAVNGKNWANVSAPGSYVELNRTWKNGDRVTLKLPKSLHLEATSDNANRAAIMWGPLALAGDLGPDDDASLREIRENLPVLVAANRPLTQWLAPVAGRAGAFNTVGVGRPHEVKLVPFYQLHARTYSIYWDLFTPAQWEVEAAAIAAERERQKQLEAATIGFAQPGEMQPERDFNQQGEGTQPDRIDGRAARRGTHWFSFDLPVDATQPNALVLTYNSGEWRARDFSISIDGKPLATPKIERQLPARFYDAQYVLPAELVRGKTVITVRFDASKGSEIAAIFGIRTIRLPAVVAIDPPAEGFFAKQIDYEGIRIKAPAVVDDAALIEARRRLEMMMKNLPSVRAKLAKAGAQLHIIGKNQVTSDLPEHRELKGKPLPEYNSLTVDQRTRGLGGLLTSCGEENLLNLADDRYKGRDICVHEFAHNIQDRGVSDEVRAVIRARYMASTAKGLWKGSYAASNESEFFAELTMWFFGTHGDLNMAGEKPANGPEGLRAYDAEAFKLMDDFYGGRLTER